MMKSEQSSLQHYPQSGNSKKSLSKKPLTIFRTEEYKNNFDNIVWTKPEEKEHKPKFKVRINGVLQYPEDDDE